MKITILDNSKIKYRSHYLTAHQTYDDIDDVTAQQLIDSGDAKLAGDDINGSSFASAEEAQHTPEFDPKREGYKGEAKLSARQKKELEEKGEATNNKGETIKADDTPVDTSTPAEPAAPKEQTEVLGEDGQPLSEEQIRAKEAAVAGRAPSDAIPTVGEADKAPEVPQS